MKTLLLNLPYHIPIMRRYIASYYAPNFLLPPYELMSLGTIVKEWKKSPVHLIDAVAEKYTLDDVLKRINEYNPDILVSMPGFESFSEDIEILSYIKSSFPKMKVIIFGYLSTLFAEDVLKYSNLDIVIRGEPEITFSYLFDVLVKNNASLFSLLGISYRKGETIISNPDSSRIDELDLFPFPDPELIKLKLYREPYLGRRVMAFYSARGCKGNCVYCVKSFGHHIHAKTPENVIKKLMWYKKNHKIHNFRFLDDNFTYDKKRVIEICKKIISEKIKIKWTCLSRIDTLDMEILTYLKQAGCKRIYLGIESGSDKILKLYNKNYNLDDMRSKIKMLHKVGIDFTGFFIVGAPFENEEDVQESINFAIEQNFDYIIVTRLKFIPGTEMFKKNKDKIEFSLFPYKAIFESSEYEKKVFSLERLFYKKFYFRLGYCLKKIKLIFISPINIIHGIYMLKRFLKSKENRDFI